MGEIRFIISQREIDMLIDFADKGCNISDINLQWTSELDNLLGLLGKIVKNPDSDDYIELDPKLKLRLVEALEKIAVEVSWIKTSFGIQNDMIERMLDAIEKQGD